MFRIPLHALWLPEPLYQGIPWLMTAVCACALALYHLNPTLPAICLTLISGLYAVGVFGMRLYGR